MKEKPIYIKVELSKETKKKIQGADSPNKLRKSMKNYVSSLEELANNQDSAIQRPVLFEILHKSKDLLVSNSDEHYSSIKKQRKKQNKKRPEKFEKSTKSDNNPKLPPQTSTSIALEEKIKEFAENSRQISYDSLMVFQEIMLKDIESKKYKYFAPEALYLIAKDMRERGCHFNLSASYDLFKNQSKLEDFLQTSLQEAQWKPQCFDLTLEAIELTLEHLSKSLENNSEKFFEKYGGPAGTYWLAKDLTGKVNKINSNQLRKIYTLVSKPDTLKRLLNSKDERFDTIWKPRVILFSPEEIDRIAEFLKSHYDNNKDNFYKIYGSSTGALILSKELGQDFTSSLDRLTTLLVNPDLIQNILGITDPDFEKKWNVTSMKSTTQLSDLVVDHLRQAYSSDSSAFFDRYGSEIGVYNLAKDLFETQKIDIDAGVICPIIRDGNLLSKMLDIEDKRFSTQWSAVTLKSKYSEMELMTSFLRGQYEEDPEKFFERYGSSAGFYYFMKDIRQVSPKKPGPHLGTFFINGKRLASMMGVNDEKFLTSWRPRSLTCNDEQIDVIANFLKKEYEHDSNQFFATYGGKTGVAKLEQKLQKECNLKMSAFRLSNIMLDSSMVAELVGVKDQRFFTDWNTKSIQTSGGATQTVADFMTHSYKSDKMKFFIRYGSKAGQYLLLKDLEKQGIAMPPIQLNSLVGNPLVLSELTDIPLKDLKTNWNNKPIYLSSRDFDIVIDTLKAQYEADPDAFFESYKNPNAIKNLAKKLQTEKEISPNLSLLRNSIYDGEMVSSLMKVKDSRFKEQWKLLDESSSMGQATAVTDFVKSAYAQNPAEFIGKYGSPSGLYSLAKDLDKNNMLKDSRLDGLSLLLSTDKLQELLNLSPSQVEQWQPRKLNFNFKELKLIVQHLQKTFDENKDAFFQRYTTPASTLICAEEALRYLGVNEHTQSISSLFPNGAFLSELIERTDERFTDQKSWGKKTLSLIKSTQKAEDLERSVLMATERMKRTATLDGVTLSDQSDRHYLNLRDALRTVILPTSEYIVELYDPENANKIKVNMQRSVQIDDKNLSKLSKINERPETKPAEQNMTKLAGHLLYSFDQDIRQQTTANLVRIYTPLFESATGKYQQELWDAFINYCTRFDYFNLMKRPRREEFTFANGLYGTLRNGVLVLQKGQKVQSFDSPLYEGEDESRHGVIG